jgi:hypothetical protein
VVVHVEKNAVIVASAEISVLDANTMPWVLGKLPANVTSQIPVLTSRTVTVTVEGQEV